MRLEGSPTRRLCLCIYVRICACVPCAATGAAALVLGGRFGCARRRHLLAEQPAEVVAASTPPEGVGLHLRATAATATSTAAAAAAVTATATAATATSTAAAAVTATATAATASSSAAAAALTAAAAALATASAALASRECQRWWR